MVPVAPFSFGTLCHLHLAQMLRRGNHSPIKREELFSETRDWIHQMILAVDLPDEPLLSEAAQRYYGSSDRK